MESFYIFSWDLLGSGADGLVFYSRIACLTHVTVTIYIIIDDGDDDDANNNTEFFQAQTWLYSLVQIFSEVYWNLVNIIDVRTF